MSRQRVKLSSPLRRRKLLVLCGYLLTIVLLTSVACQHAVSSRRDDWSVFDQKSAHVTKVIDGDTIDIRTNDGTVTRVRLLGIDAPEMDDATTNRPAHWAERATNYMKARASDKQITLRLEPIQTRDRYGRLLAYVYLSDTDCLNIDLVRDGQAYADRRFRHSYRPQYEQAENEARKKQRGLWKDVTEEAMPAWRRAWLHSRDRN
jgi:micrococcal nuclease